jgi:glutamyl-tRNA reductase
MGAREMKVIVAGLNHKSAPVDFREKLALAGKDIPDALTYLRNHNNVREAVIISTCNRVEVYAYYGESERPDLKSFFSSYFGIWPEVLTDHIYEYTDLEAVRHLFKVACSLDSMVIGETQILGQVKDAYLLALEEASTGKRLNSLFQTALGVAKKVHSVSLLSEYKVSVSSVAVEFAEKIFENLDQKTVLVVGSGETARLVLIHLRDRGVRRVMVTNRSFEKAEELAKEFGGTPIPFERMGDHLSTADILIASTAAPHYVVRAPGIRSALKARRRRPMLLLDIAVPRDIEPNVEGYDGVFLYNIDDLERIAAENLELRKEEIAIALEIVEAEVDKFRRRTSGEVVGPSVQSLQRSLEEIKEAELVRLYGKLPELTEKEKEEVRRMAERILGKVIHKPLEVIKDEAREGRRDALRLFRRLFGLEE